VQRLAASALCNLSANHDENKKLARSAGLVDALIKLLKSSTDDAVQVLCLLFLICELLPRPICRCFRASNPPKYELMRIVSAALAQVA